MNTSLFDFLLEIVAVFIGVFAAFFLDNYREERAQKKENSRLLHLLREEIESNKGILSGMRETKPGAVPHGRPMQNVWQSIVSKFDVMKEDELFSEVTYLYWVIGNLDRMVDLYMEYTATHMYLPDQLARQTMESRLESQREHIRTYIVNEGLPQIEKVLKLIEQEDRGT
jgi:hypothetical protein